MGSSNVSSVTKFFPTANEGFIATLQTTIAPGATTIGLSTVTGLTTGTVFVGVIEPGTANQQVFTGTVDVPGSQITGVVWTRGSNVTHNSGVTIVDYTTGTDLNMITTGILKFANQAGQIVAAAFYDANGNKTIEFVTTPSSVNNIQIVPAITGHPATIQAGGTDSQSGINFVPKGADTAGGTAGGLFYNGVQFRALARDWTRVIMPTELAVTEQPVGTVSMAHGTGWGFPADTASWLETSNTQNAELRFKLYLDAGTYTFKNYYRTGADKGIVTSGIMNEAGSVTTLDSGSDLYAASGSTSVSVILSSVVVTSGGYYKFWHKTATKNASSTGYILPYFGTQIIRTA